MLLLGLRRAESLVLDNGAVSRETRTQFLQSIGMGCGCQQDTAGNGSRPEP